MSSRSSRATFFMAFGFSANFLSSLTCCWNCCWNCCGYWGCCGNDAACPRTSATKHSDTYWLYFILKRKLPISMNKNYSTRWLIEKELCSIMRSWIKIEIIIQIRVMWKICHNVKYHLDDSKEKTKMSNQIQERILIRDLQSCSKYVSVPHMFFFSSFLSSF